MSERPTENVKLADEDLDNESSNPSPQPSLSRVIELRLSRREALGKNRDRYGY